MASSVPEKALFGDRGNLEESSVSSSSSRIGLAELLSKD